MEWRAQQAAAIVDPTGDERDDLRAAVMTANIISSQSSQEIADAEFKEMLVNLADYLQRRKQSDEVDLEALERMKQKHGGNR